MTNAPPRAAPTETKDELETLIETRERRAWSYDCDTFLMKSKGGFGKIRIRVPTVEELNSALLASRQYCADYVKKSGLEPDADLTNNTRVAHIMNLVCRHATDDRPAFQGPKWMMKTLVADEFSVLLNLYHQTLKLATPLDLNIDDDKIEQVASVCVALKSEEKLNEYIAAFTREILAEQVIRLSIKLADARREADALREELATLRGGAMEEPALAVAPPSEDEEATSA